MNLNRESSVYELITGLCGTLSKDIVFVKRLRSKAFAILLGKTAAKLSFSVKDLQGPDSYCNLLAWQYTLSSKYGLTQQAEKLQELGDTVRKAYGDDVIQFLLSFRTIPRRDDESPEFELVDNFRKLYRSEAGLSDEHLSEDIGDRSLSPSVWESASKGRLSDRKTWEDFGQVQPDPEKPFLSELGSLSHLWVENLPSVYLSMMSQGEILIKPENKPLKDFVQDIKYLLGERRSCAKHLKSESGMTIHSILFLVGMASYSFSAEKNGNFFLLSNISIAGLSPQMLKKYSQEFIFAGVCYKSLYEISTPSPYSGEYKQDGYIFAELCQSIQRYLEFYRTAVMSLPDSLGLLKLHERTRQLRDHLTTLAAVCKLGPAASNRMPHGVSLLNYLYQTILTLTDKNLLLVLYAILFPCCQVYFSRFLQQWLLEGTVNDPYEEFFIKPNFKYISTRGRTYWTRSYSLREDIVPDFLLDLRTDILNCGKAMNLLKLCVNSNKLCLYLMGTKPLIVSCCLTFDQLSQLEQNATSYYFEVLAECGPGINFERILSQTKEHDPIFMSLIAQKRAATLTRLELERKRILEEEREKKFEEISSLKEQYDSAVKLKELRFASEIESEISLIEFNLTIEHSRDKLIEKEANVLIGYYQELHAIANRRQRKINNHITRLKSCLLDEPIPLEANSSDESFYSLDEPTNEETPNNQGKELDTESKSFHSSKSLDLINANEEAEKPGVKPSLETFEIAEKIKNNGREAEMGILTRTSTNEKPNLDNLVKLTDAQKNKFKVLGTEFGIEIKQPLLSLVKKPSQAEINRNLVLGTSDCFHYEKLDNVNYVNKNFTSSITCDKENKMKKSVSLSLDIVTLDYPTPMSIDSTPASDSTISRIPLSVDKADFESIPTTAETQITDEGFDFEERREQVPYTPPIKKTLSATFQKNVFSKRVSEEEASGLSTNCLKLFLHESIAIPLATQSKLVDSQLLKYFIDDLHYLEHLNSLRDYFFLQDGEFGRNITENLFGRLYDVHFPIELVNCRTLQKLVFQALQVSSKPAENSGCLSFKINSLPGRFHLGDPDVLDCLSFTYKVKWPLNILLPADSIAKYDEVFKYLLKLNRISWVMKKVFLELKMLAKLSGKKEIYLMMSPQYRKLHQCRHVMLHFIQTLQNYIVGEVLQASWELFGRNLTTVNDLDALYMAHNAYIKDILFLCLLNQKSTPLRKVVHKIFVVVLKFYDHLRSRSWRCGEDGVYVHPNFAKLESIFRNFEEFVLYLFKVGRKFAKNEYRPHVNQLLDMLDVNGFYLKKNYSRG